MLNVTQKRRNTNLNDTEIPFFIFQIGKNPKFYKPLCFEDIVKWAFSHTVSKNFNWENPYAGQFGNTYLIEKYIRCFTEHFHLWALILHMYVCSGKMRYKPDVSDHHSSQPLLQLGMTMPLNSSQ